MMIKGFPPYSNTYIIKRFDQAIIIDPSFNEEELLNRIEGYHVVGVLLTHGHANHNGLLGLFNCPIYIHRKDYKTLIDDELSGYLKYKYKRNFEFDQLFIKFLDDKSVIKIADKVISVIATPGHTEGSASFLYDDMLFTGDTLNKDGVGKVKKKKGARAQINKSIEKIYKNCPLSTTIYPGHGGPITLGNLKKTNKRIQQILK